MKTKLLFILFCFLSYPVFAQKIAKNELDEFTGKRVIETSWESISKKHMKNLQCYVRFRAVDEFVYLNFKVITLNN